MPAPEHYHKLLDAAHDGKTVYDPLAPCDPEVGVVARLYTIEGESFIEVGQGAERATFEPPHKWGITPEEAFEAVRDKKWFWHKKDSRHPFMAESIIHYHRGDVWFLNGVLLENVSLVEPPQ